MELTVEHNLNDTELRKAITGMAIAGGVSHEVMETLEKACACDETPKVPRYRATRTLFKKMQIVYRDACRSIEQYAIIARHGTLEKATYTGGLTAPQLQQLQRAITDRFGFIAGQIQSVDYTPPADQLQRWKNLGLVPPETTPETFMAAVPAEMHFVRNAFLMGRFIDAVEAGKSFSEVMSLAMNSPILAPDTHAIAVAEQETANYITNAAADISTAVGKLWAKQQAEQIRNMAIDYHDRRLARTILDQQEKEEAGVPTPKLTVDTWRQFSSELHHTLDDQARDWDRVAFYELTDAQKQGQGHRLLERIGPSGMVYKVPMATACPQCKHVYLKPDGRPKLFKLSALLRNGTNIGRKPHPIKGGKVNPIGRTDGKETLKAVAGLVHPWCQCSGPYEYTGHEPWAKGKP